MSGIFEAIKSFFTFIISSVQFAIKLIKDLIYVVKMLGLTVAKIPTYLGFLPTVVISMFALCLSVVIVYKVLGRD